MKNAVKSLVFLLLSVLSALAAGYFIGKYGWGAYAVWSALAIGAIGLASAAWTEVYEHGRQSVLRFRNFGQQIKRR